MMSRFGQQMGAVGAACLLLVCTPTLCRSAGSDLPGKVVGLAFVGRMVSDLDRSVVFYQALGFSPDPMVDSAWRKDDAIGRLYGAPGVETRAATLAILNAASGQPFTVRLREVRGIGRRNLAGHSAWEPAATHFSLVVSDAAMLWARLETAGQLRARSWGARLIAPPGQTLGRIAYLTDPDGLDIELLNQRQTPDASGASKDPDTQPGVGHAGIVVRNSAKAKAFYGGLLGGHPQSADSPWLKGDFFDSVVGGHGNIMRVFDESFAEASAPEFRLNFALIEFQNRKKAVAPQRITDSGLGYVGFEVRGLDGLLARAKAAGAKLVSDGIATTSDGTREVIIRDPDVGGFIELFERPTERARCNVPCNPK
ncbi:MAG: VOC family protein [Steroidobacteraceae bacterium]